MLKHENIVELYEYFENKEDYVMLMEHCNDANYFSNKIENVSHQILTQFSNLFFWSFLKKRTEIKNEEKLRSYSMDMLTGLDYIHKSNIIHADMKLPNILMQRPTIEEKQQGELPIVKICDFGISQIMKP